MKFLGRYLWWSSQHPIQNAALCAGLKKAGHACHLQGIHADKFIYVYAHQVVDPKELARKRAAETKEATMRKFAAGTKKISSFFTKK